VSDVFGRTAVDPDRLTVEDGVDERHESVETSSLVESAVSESIEVIAPVLCALQDWSSKHPIQESHE
jgi:DNA-binding HxlR family transcriptional regulator